MPATSGHYFWTIRVNGVYGEPAHLISTPEQYYFTLPTHDERLTSPSDKEKAVDLSQHPVLGRFPSYYENGRKYVVLARGNRLPFVKLTKGEYLDALGAAIAYQYERERIRITEANQGDKVRIAREMVSEDERRAKRLAAIAVNRERYKSRLQEVAETPNVQPNLVIENHPDVFLESGGNRPHIPVYKVDPALAELAKTGAPQWIVVAWDSELNRPHEQAAARRHRQQLRLRVPLQLLLRAREGHRPVLCAAPQSGGDRNGRDDRGVGVEQGARGRSQRAFLRGLLDDARRQDAGRLEKHIE